MMIQSDELTPSFFRGVGFSKPPTSHESLFMKLQKNLLVIMVTMGMKHDETTTKTMELWLWDPSPRRNKMLALALQHQLALSSSGRFEKLWTPKSWYPDGSLK